MGGKREAWATAITMALLLLISRPTMGQDKAEKGDKAAAPGTGVDAKTAFKKMKSLAGTWTVHLKSDKPQEKAKEDAEKHGMETKVVFKITAGGSALTETQFPGQAHEMVSVYHLDGDDLLMTHYCSIGNQPRVKLDKSKSTADRLVFAFDGGTNLDAKKDQHIHGLTINMHSDGSVTSDWEGYTDGKSAGSTSFVMSR